MKAIRWAVFVVVLLAILDAGGPARAHKITIFAAVRGGLIEGQVSSQGGTPASDMRLTISDGAGREVAKMVTDKDGKFQFEPHYRSDYRLVANAGLGHKAETTISASALPADLPPADGQEISGPAKSAQPPSSQPPSSQQAGPSSEMIPRDDVVQQIRELSEQAVALRMELDRWREQMRWQDMLGGIGYIVGIAGLAFFILGYRHRNR